jgi:hypothetical protein
MNIKMDLFAATLHIWKPFLHLCPEDTPCRGDKGPLILEDNIKMDLWKWDVENRLESSGLGQGHIGCCCEFDNKLYGSIKCGDFLTS